MTSFILSWLGISFDYLISAILFFGGAFLSFYVGVAFPIPVVSGIVKWVGYMLMIVGFAFGIFSYGKSVGAADCYSAWHKADVAFEDAKQNQETTAGNVAAKTANDQAQQLTQQYNDYQKEISQYQSTIAPTATCRMPTVDDDRRMCDIIGNGAAGCKNSK